MRTILVGLEMDEPVTVNARALPHAAVLGVIAAVGILSPWALIGGAAWVLITVVRGA